MRTKKSARPVIHHCLINLGDMSERDISALVGYVPQTHIPAFGHTVFDFVQMGCASRIGLFSHPGKSERALTENALSEMGLEQLADRPYTEISGGERQLATIARAIVSRPQIVLFDEPTAHLDFGNQLRVLRIIKELSEKGFAVVFTTHNPDHAMLLGGSAAGARGQTAPVRMGRQARRMDKALARDTGSIGSRWNLARGLYRLTRARPLSITKRTAGMVSEVSATLVASTMRRPECGLNTSACWLADRRPNSARTWCRRPGRAAPSR